MRGPDGVETALYVAFVILITGIYIQIFVSCELRCCVLPVDVNSSFSKKDHKLYPELLDPEEAKMEAPIQEALRLVCSRQRTPHGLIDVPEPEFPQRQRGLTALLSAGFKSYALKLERWLLLTCMYSL